MCEIDIMRFCAFRYALGRSSYVTGTVQDVLIKAKWDIGSIERCKYIEEVLATPADRLGMEMDAIGWLNMCSEFDEYAEYTDNIVRKYEEVRSLHS